METLREACEPVRKERAASTGSKRKKKKKDLKFIVLVKVTVRAQKKKTLKFRGLNKMLISSSCIPVRRPAFSTC